MMCFDILDSKFIHQMIFSYFILSCYFFFLFLIRNNNVIKDIILIIFFLFYVGFLKSNSLLLSFITVFCLRKRKVHALFLIDLLLFFFDDTRISCFFSFHYSVFINGKDNIMKLKICFSNQSYSRKWLDEGLKDTPPPIIGNL